MYHPTVRRWDWRQWQSKVLMEGNINKDCYASPNANNLIHVNICSMFTISVRDSAASQMQYSAVSTPEGQSSTCLYDPNPVALSSNTGYIEIYCMTASGCNLQYVLTFFCISTIATPSPTTSAPATLTPTTPIPLTTTATFHPPTLPPVYYTTQSPTPKSSSSSSDNCSCDAYPWKVATGVMASLISFVFILGFRYMLCSALSPCYAVSPSYPVVPAAPPAHVIEVVECKKQKPKKTSKKKKPKPP